MLDEYVSGINAQLAAPFGNPMATISAQGSTAAKVGVGTVVVMEVAVAGLVIVNAAKFMGWIR